MFLTGKQGEYNRMKAMGAREKHSSFSVTRIASLRVCSARRLLRVGVVSNDSARSPTHAQLRALHTRSGTIRVTEKFKSFFLALTALTLFSLYFETFISYKHIHINHKL